MFQGLASNPALARCLQILLKELQSGYDTCSSLRKYVSCAVEVFNLNSDDEYEMLQLLASNLRNSGIYCDFGIAQNGNGQDGNDQDWNTQDENATGGNDQDWNAQNETVTVGNGQDGNGQDWNAQNETVTVGNGQDGNGQD
ncbi:hypothetical protein PoB_003481600 [Plakobranchus ocellatus]|uniref:Uncharacterized protein n=1 Tax=Plakobranchus ocellatus TaxID=259542 RepID=A0AAV4AP02_9GAST|nr:hypothetical protein PoB_003481600 [Plakobranchus ocellatus]